ncbi:MAG: hypothetical protein WCS03_17055 [Bacteroidota bacterium]
MKKLLLIYSLLISVLGSAQQINKPFSFPIKPGTKEWSTLKTEKERFNAMQIPEDTLKRMTTSALVISCLNYPAFGFITAYDNYQGGLVYLATKFNGLDELAKRNDVEKCLIPIYKLTGLKGIENSSMSIDNKFWTIKFSWIEMLMAQNIFIESLSSEGKKELITLALEKYNLKRSNSDYSMYSLVTTTFLAARAIHSLNIPTFESEFFRNQSLSNFIKTSKECNKLIIDYVFEFASDYTK